MTHIITVFRKLGIHINRCY